MMSLHVTLSSPSKVSHRVERFLLGWLTCRGAGTRAHRRLVFSSSRAFSPSDRDVKTATFPKAAGAASTDAAAFSEGTIIFFSFYFNTVFFFSFPPARTRVEFKKAPFRTPRAVMEYDMLVIFPRPRQIAPTAYYACFLTFVLFVSCHTDR